MRQSTSEPRVPFSRHHPVSIPWAPRPFLTLSSLRARHWKSHRVVATILWLTFTRATQDKEKRQRFHLDVRVESVENGRNCGYSGWCRLPASQILGWRMDLGPVPYFFFPPLLPPSCLLCSLTHIAAARSAPPLGTHWEILVPWLSGQNQGSVDPAHLM